MTTTDRSTKRWNDAKALLELIELSKIPDRLAADLANKFRAQFGEPEEGEQVPEALKNSVVLVLDRLRAGAGELFCRFVDIYAEAFDEEQIAMLADYYRGPVAQLLNAKNEGVQQRIMDASNAWATEEFQKLSPDLAKELNTPLEAPPQPQPSPQP